MDENINQNAPNAEMTDSQAQVAEFPNEPFPCPACGQLLAPSCRVCVACKHVIDPGELARPKQPPSPVAEVLHAERQPERVRFSWPIFFAVFGVSCFLVLIFQRFIKDQQQVVLAMGGVQSLAGVWVFYDAARRRVPRPVRWAVGSMMLPLIIFPWYLARRSTPKSPVPFLEAVSTIRLVFIALLLFFLANLIFYLVEGPPPGTHPTSPPTTNPTPPPTQRRAGGNSQSKVAYLQLQASQGQHGRTSAVPQPLSAVSAVHIETSAPSDAWHT